MSYLDRTRAARLLRAGGFDALVLFQPEAFRYATRMDAGVASMWRRGGAALALVPSDAQAPLAAIVADHTLHFGAPSPAAIELVSHPIWIDYVDYTPNGDDAVAGVKAAYRAQGLGAARPEAFEAAAVFRLLGELLSERGLSNAIIGADLEFLPAADFAALQKALPRVRWRDGSEILRRLRCIKSTREIACLRRAVELYEAGLGHMVAHLERGMPRSMLERLWRAGVAQAAAASNLSVSGDRAGIAIGPDLMSADPMLCEGDLIKADMGVAIDGYLSDSTRIYALGRPSQAARRIFGVLEEAFAAGLDAIRPGAALGDVHATVLATTRRLGLTDYHRGHFGHSIGSSCGSEEWPYISAENPEPIEPGMVLAFETPFYAHGLGALMIEDQLLVTRTGVETLSRLPRQLVELPVDTGRGAERSTGTRLDASSARCADEPRGLDGILRLVERHRPLAPPVGPDQNHHSDQCGEHDDVDHRPAHQLKDRAGQERRRCHESEDQEVRQPLQRDRPGRGRGVRDHHRRTGVCEVPANSQQHERHPECSQMLARKRDRRPQRDDGDAGDHDPKVPEPFDQAPGDQAGSEHADDVPLDAEGGVVLAETAGDDGQRRSRHREAHRAIGDGGADHRDEIGAGHRKARPQPTARPRRERRFGGRASQSMPAGQLQERQKGDRQRRENDLTGKCRGVRGAEPDRFGMDRDLRADHRRA
ncbi:M24 family metallopeptidase [Consotaella sp. CSK11QG-6]